MNLWTLGIAVMPRASFLFIPINRFIRIRASTFAIARARDPTRTMVESSFRSNDWVRHSCRLALTVAILVLILAITWAARASILRSAAEFWVVSDEPSQADAIVVLGGGLDMRPFAAADLYKRGLAPWVLVANVERNPVEALNILPRQADLTRQMLVK